MTRAADAAAAAAIDPTALALLGIFGGAAIAAIAGFIGAWIQGRREHEKWVREKRYEAYLTVMRLAETLLEWAADMDAHRAAEQGLVRFPKAAKLDPHTVSERLREGHEAMREAMVLLAVVGPVKVEQCFREACDHSGSSREYLPRHRALMEEMRRALGIGNS